MAPASLIAECLDENAIAELVSGGLSGAALARVEAHLARCGACRTTVAHAAKAVESGIAVGPSTSTPDAEREDVPLPRGARVGRYEVRECVGVGAMGTVYAAHDPALDRKIALKLIRAKVAGPDLEARLLREAKAMARLSHPEVIAVHDAGRDGDRLFIAMEFVEGGTLREWLHAAPRTSREILTAYQRAGRGLAQAHAAGIVHRDFKPDNVLVGSDGRVRVTDFGLARAARSEERVEAGASEDVAAEDDAAMLDANLTRTGTLVGTPVYMAPEQLAGRLADVRSDVYSFSVALYEALYGERPFAGRTLKDLVHAKNVNDVRTPKASSKISHRLRRALLVGLRARPEDRYASMDELLAALERATHPPRARFVALGSVLAAAAAGLLLVKPWSPAPSHAPTSTSSTVATPPAATAEGETCANHRECIERHSGAPYMCRAETKTCAAVASEDCVAKFEPSDLSADDTIWLGAMFPLKGPAAAAYGTMSMEGTDFARREIAKATRPLQGANASMRVRPIALVACDDTQDPMRAARHLVDDLGVAAIVGCGTGQRVVDLAGSLLIRRGVVAVASLTPSPLITRLPQPSELPHMVWRTTFSLDDVANATANMIHDVLEPRLAARPTRVILTRDESASALSFAEVFHKRLVFNGKPAVENGGDYAEITLQTNAPPASEVARAADRIVEAAPSLVVLLGTSQATLPMLDRIEGHWRTGAPRPTYVVGNDSLAAFAPYLSKSIDRRRRLFAIESVSTSAANTRFVMRYNDGHDAHVQLTLNPSSSYDGFYLLAYAAFALRDEAVTGPALARAFGRLLPPGTRIEVGPTQVFDGLRALAGGGHIDLEGAATGLDFDLATGEAPADFALLCAGVDADGIATGVDVESGVVFHATTQRVEGTPRCP